MYALNAQQSQIQSCSVLTELVLPASIDDRLHVVMPMLAHLSRQDSQRWLTWIAPPYIERKVLEKFQFCTKNIRLVHTHEDQCLDACLLALEQGTSATVVTQVHLLTKRMRERLNSAALKGSSRGILLRQY